MDDITRGKNIIPDPKIGVCDDAAVFVQIKSVEKISRRTNSDADDDNIGVDRLTRLKKNFFNAIFTLKTGNVRCQSKLNSVFLVHVLKQLSDLGPERLFK